MSKLFIALKLFFLTQNCLVFFLFFACVELFQTYMTELKIITETQTKL